MANNREWGEDYEPYSVLADSERIFALVVKTYRRVGTESKESGWDAFDMTRQNASQTGNYSIGHFKTRAFAKKAVEKHFAAKDNGGSI